MIAAPPTPLDEQRLRLSCVPWAAYVAFSDGLGESQTRVTYDNGEMEIMTVSSRHEREKSRLLRLIHVLTEELEIDIASAGSMTCRNEKMARALEPDECFWIKHEALVRGRDDIDLENDPPPDLAVQIEISRSAMDRMAIFAALAVPEVWRWDGTSLSVHVLGGRGTYRAAKRSKAFSFLPIDEFRAFLLRRDLGETKLVRTFRAWVRDHSSVWKIA